MDHSFSCFFTNLYITVAGAGPSPPGYEEEGRGKKQSND